MKNMQFKKKKKKHTKKKTKPTKKSNKKGKKLHFYNGNYHSELTVGRTDIREGGVLANPENSVVCGRSAVGSSIPIHLTPTTTTNRGLYENTEENISHSFRYQKPNTGESSTDFAILQP